MSPDWRFGAENEAAEAAAYYDGERPGLGDEFLDAVETAIHTIVEAPHRWPRWPGAASHLEIRRRYVKRFPYSVAYLVHGNRIAILAVVHAKRRPGYWFGRQSK
jgi:toxin ParE1/3/4